MKWCVECNRVVHSERCDKPGHDELCDTKKVTELRDSMNRVAETERILQDVKRAKEASSRYLKFDFILSQLKSAEKEGPGCPYCSVSKQECVPEVVSLNAECYGGKLVRFKCKDCGCVVEAYSQVTVSVLGLKKTDKESDW